jgi:hypothetical protein
MVYVDRRFSPCGLETLSVPLDLEESCEKACYDPRND